MTSENTNTLQFDPSWEKHLLRLILRSFLYFQVLILGSIIICPLPNALGGSATLAWDKNPENDLSGYFLYMGTSPGIYGSPIDVGNVTTFQLTGLMEGYTYFWALTAYDSAGNESFPTAEVSTTIKLTPPTPSNPTHLLVANFSQGPEGFVYVDDPFRGTTAPSYASGVFLSGGGITHGALHVHLGGLDNNNIYGMSGGWQTTFTLPGESDISLEFHYTLTQAPGYEGDEFSQVLVRIDSDRMGSNGKDYVAQLVSPSNNPNNPPHTTDWQVYSVSMGPLAPGEHSLIIGGYNNKKTYRNEVTDILISKVSIVAR